VQEWKAGKFLKVEFVDLKARWPKNGKRMARMVIRGVSNWKQ